MNTTISRKVKFSMNLQVKAAVDTLHFWDGVRRIDMVLAYKDPEAENDQEDNRSLDTLNDEESPDEKDEKRKHEREVFEKNLVDAGLELELEPSQVKPVTSVLKNLFYCIDNISNRSLKQHDLLLLYRDLEIREQTF